MTYDEGSTDPSPCDDSQIDSKDNRCAGPHHSNQAVVPYRPPPAQTTPGVNKEDRGDVYSEHRTTASDSGHHLMHRAQRDASTLSEATVVDSMDRSVRYGLGRSVPSSADMQGGQATAVGGSGYHQPQAPERLSQACQRYGFNPQLHVHQVRGGSKPLFTGDVKIQDITVKGTKTFHSKRDARSHAAEQGLDILRRLMATSTGQAPLGRRSTGFRATFDNRVDDHVVGAVYDRLDRLLAGRAYALQQKRDSPRYELQLQVPGGWTGDDLELHMNRNWSITFRPVELLATCQVCHTHGPASIHTRAKCPLWVQCRRPARSAVRLGPRSWSGSQETRRAGNRVRFPPRSIGHGNLAPLATTESPPVKGEDMGDGRPTNNCLSPALPKQTYDDRAAKIVREVQNFVGPPAAIRGDQDSQSKIAFLQGLALGTRLGATAPGPFEKRRRSRSPGHASSRVDPALGDDCGGGTGNPRHRSSDCYRPAYRERSPLREKSGCADSTEISMKKADDGASKRPEPGDAASAGGGQGLGPGDDFSRNSRACDSMFTRDG
ncbi:MAG: hypothetical protein JWR01_2947 [Subtercola sp.]|nr:hypothetical protein [Subtercola sp.]